MQLAMPATAPAPLRSSALQIASGELNATPATPRPLFARAAAVPATWVPWPLSSAQRPATIVGSASSGSVSSPSRSIPNDLTPAQSTTLPARSSCAARTPVSTIPIFAPFRALGKLPRLAASQPSGASMSASAAPPFWPVLCRP